MNKIFGRISSADYGFDAGKPIIKVKMNFKLTKEQYLTLIEKSHKNEVLLEVLDNE